MTDTTNGKKLAWLISTFSIPTRKMSKLIGFSPAYVSRVSSGHMAGSEAFYLALERNLERVLALRGTSLFRLNDVQVEKLEG